MLSLWLWGTLRELEDVKCFDLFCSVLQLSPPRLSVALDGQMRQFRVLSRPATDWRSQWGFIQPENFLFEPFPTLCPRRLDARRVERGNMLKGHDLTRGFGLQNSHTKAWLNQGWLTCDRHAVQEFHNHALSWIFPRSKAMKMQPAVQYGMTMMSLNIVRCVLLLIGYTKQTDRRLTLSVCMIVKLS